MLSKRGVVLLSASNYSAYTLATLSLLSKQGIPVAGVLVKSLADRGRFIREFRTEGFGLFIKAFRKIVLQRLGMGGKAQDGFSAFFNSQNITERSVSIFCANREIPCVLTPNFHDEESLKFVSQLSPDLLVFTGGGIIRKTLIERARLGAVNCHMGILPKYRGMDCTYWAILNHDLGDIGFTTHLIDSGVDTGPIIKRHHVNVEKFGSVDEIIKEMELQMAPALTDAVARLLADEVQPASQASIEGLQYYTIGAELAQIAEKKFVKYSSSIPKLQTT